MEQPQNLNNLWHSIPLGMGKKLDQVKAGSQEQFANETKSANDVVRLLRKKPTTCSYGQNNQRWTQHRAWVCARLATSRCIVKE